MANRITDYSFINCEPPYCAFVEAAYRAIAQQERAFLISSLIQYFDFVLFSGVYSFVDEKYPYNAEVGDPALEKYEKPVDALNAVRYCLRDPICQDEMWKWLLGIMVQLDSNARAAFTVCVFCPILTEPLSWDDPHEMIAIDRLLRWYENPALRWAVLEGFTEGTFEQAAATIDRYNRWCQKQGREPLAIDDAELRQYISENGWTAEDATARAETSGVEGLAEDVDWRQWLWKYRRGLDH
jgi:hypothetical protein